MASNNLPIKQIKDMRAQGMDNNKIIQTLQRDGFSSSDIFDAMNAADNPVTPTPGEEFGYEDSAPAPSSSGTAMSEGSDASGSNARSSLGSDASPEELIEAIIDEKWRELSKDFEQVLEWKKGAAERMISLEQEFKDLKGEFDKVHSALISKVDDYDKNISQVGAEVKAMEKVFSKVLPLFTENVKELSRITKDLKK